ncbi:MAG: sel1 repeat family protein, partial [Lachnospiraceae bacterium]|nr:sel1 repeat family protein [Lachnospiraceae bacterium]
MKKMRIVRWMIAVLALTALTACGKAETPDDLLAEAERLADQGEFDKAVPLLREAADQGDGLALYNLGVYYQEGTGVEQDYEKALSFYRQAAELEVPDAYVGLGYYYGNGIGVEQDKDEMIRYYRLAAEQGNAVGQHNLGYCYS